MRLIREARRIAVLGPCGAGKSTLARQLGPLLNLPVHHLDAHYWQPGWTAHPDFKPVHDRLCAGRRWIIEGNYTSWLPDRLPLTDLVIHLDYPRHTFLARIARRIAASYGRVRPDMAPGCPEKVDLEFLRYAWTFNTTQIPRIRAAFRLHPRIPILRLTHPRQTADVLANLSSSS